jgi:hypothetical protein
VILETLAVLSGALFTGGALYVSVVEQPARMRLDPRAATEQFRSSYRLAAPWQAATAVICALSGLLASAAGSSRTWAVGGLLIGLAVPFTLLAILPTTRRLLDKDGIDEGERRDLMRRWAGLHGIRSALGLVGLIALVFAALHRG